MQHHIDIEGAAEHQTVPRGEPRHAASDRAHEIEIEDRNNASEELTTVDVSNPVTSSEVMERVKRLSMKAYETDSDINGLKEIIDELTGSME